MQLLDQSHTRSVNVNLPALRRRLEATLKTFLTNVMSQQQINAIPHEDLLFRVKVDTGTDDHTVGVRRELEVGGLTDVGRL